MKLQTKIRFDLADDQIDYKSHLLVLGSCFSENIGKRFSHFKFQGFQNPFGIFYHPLAIEKLISKTILNESYSEGDIYFQNERWHCFDAHSDLSDPVKENLLTKLNDGLEKTRQQLNKATHIIITLGTAWIYRNLATNEVVANCHKIAQKNFSKELLSIEDIEKSLEGITSNIRTLNENAQFIFTVSPVRHLKNGFIENQRSKAHLISAIHDLLSLQAELKNAFYFPSYEIMMDELRDYRFYEADMIHPNQVAIHYIWEKFKEVWISPTAHPTMEKVDAVQKGLQHRPFNSNSERHMLFLKSLDEKIMYLQEEYPFMKFAE